jgi:phthalate 4,5-cis-dihydrodiol dehydrogenase
MSSQSERPVGLGIAGLGGAGAAMVIAAARHRGVTLAAAADLNEPPRAAFARDFNARAYADIRALCEDPAVEAVYIATPHQFHAEHAILAAERGKHIVLEKPMALTLADCDRIIDAVERAGVRMIVGHTHAFDPAVRKMREIVASGELGRLGMIASWNYTNFLYRPRRPEELDEARGGGILFNQVPHQVDTVRLLGGGRVRSVRAQLGALDSARPVPANCNAFLTFESGATASLVYSGYDFFDTDELHFWVSERGSAKQPGHGKARRSLAARQESEAELRVANSAYGAADASEPPHQPHFGVTVVTCERGDMRASADGVFVYGIDGMRELPVQAGQQWSGRGPVLDDLVAAVRNNRPPIQDARWAKRPLRSHWRSAARRASSARSCWNIRLAPSGSRSCTARGLDPGSHLSMTAAPDGSPGQAGDDGGSRRGDAGKWPHSFSCMAPGTARGAGGGSRSCCARAGTTCSCRRSRASPTARTCSAPMSGSTRTSRM